MTKRKISATGNDEAHMAAIELLTADLERDIQGLLAMDSEAQDIVSSLKDPSSASGERSTPVQRS